ncbi:MAG: nucleotidyltransferase domain-containing protein [Armatimonadetes bacterium]|nr:nucleotidyltransferase domain-containing protein [Armatimonadota bacterium]
MKSATELQMPPDLRKVLDEAVARIVEIADPQAIILFGSHAEGRSHPKSDFDLMVIVDSQRTGEVLGDLYEAIADIRAEHDFGVPPVDIIAMTPQEWAYEVQLPGLVVWRAHRYGVVLHGQVA